MTPRPEAPPRSHADGTGGNPALAVAPGPRFTGLGRGLESRARDRGDRESTGDVGWNDST
jgi:hypothetical protein